MENYVEPSREELEKMLEQAQKELQAKLDKMTPEERAQAERNAKKVIEEDRASMQRLLDDAARIAGKASPKERPRVCPNCGAPAGGGRFCEYCGSPLL